MDKCKLAYTLFYVLTPLELNESSVINLKTLNIHVYYNHLVVLLVRITGLYVVVTSRHTCRLAYIHACIPLL